jgi:hypothetical protein
MRVGGQRHTTAALPLGKTGCPLFRRPNRSQDRNGRVRESSLAGIRSSNGPASSESLQRLRSRPDCTQYCYIMDTFPFSQSFHKKTLNKFNSPWRGRQHDPPKHQNKLFIKSNVRTRRLLDPCCTFGCCKVQMLTPKPAIMISIYP